MLPEYPTYRHGILDLVQSREFPSVSDRRKKAFLSAIVIFLFSLILTTPAISEVFEVEILDYGIYEFQTTQIVEDKNAIGGTMSLAEEVNLISTTKAIPAMINTNFGFRYKINGIPPGSDIRITRVTIYPPTGLTDPKSGKTYYNYNKSFVRRIGEKEYYVGFGFDKEWELVPGTWIFQLWYEGTKLAEEKFMVHAP